MKYIFMMIIISLISSGVFAQNISVQATGICREFDVLITTDLEGCWDVKIDADGRVLNHGQWKSTFFYVPNFTCMPGKETQLKIRLEEKGNLTAIAKFRQNNTIIEEPFEIVQNCPEALDETYTMMFALILVIVLFAGILVYKRR